MIEFGTAGIRGNVTTHLRPAAALSVGKAVGQFVVETTNNTYSSPEIVIGRDGRTTGVGLAAALEAGVVSAGCQAIRIGQVPTPTLAFASRGRLGLMVTASHNPPTDNGIKCFVDGREFDSDHESVIEQYVAEDRQPADWDDWASTTTTDLLPAYQQAVVDYSHQFGSDCEGLRVAVDCANGMAATATPQVLRELGVDAITFNANVDGHFPARPSKPTPETLSEFRRLLADSEFAFGIAHDGDADRIVILDGDGEIIHEDTVLAILAGYYTREYADEHGANADDPVVITTPNASGRIDEQVAAAGGRIERVALGGLHEGIAAVESTPGEQVVFAAEPWKHIHPAFGTWTDGITSAAVLSRIVAETGLAGLREPITERPYRKISVDCPDDRKPTAMTQLETALPEAFDEAEASFEHGVRLRFPDESWLLVRPSGTEPYIRLYAESDEVEQLVEQTTALLEAVVDA